MTVRGGGVPGQVYGFHARQQNGPAASELRWPMHITASWSGSLSHRIEGCGTNVRAPIKHYRAIATRFDKLANTSASLWDSPSKTTPRLASVSRVSAWLER